MTIRDHNWVQWASRFPSRQFVTLAGCTQGDVCFLEILPHIWPVVGVLQRAVRLFESEMTQSVMHQQEEHFSNITMSGDDETLSNIHQTINSSEPRTAIQ